MYFTRNHNVLQPVCLYLLLSFIFFLVSSIGIQQQVYAADPPCTRTINPGSNIQDAIDQAVDYTGTYVLCLNPGNYRGGKNNTDATLLESNHNFGSSLPVPSGNTDTWNYSATGPYYGNIVIRNKSNFELRGLTDSQGNRAVILGIRNDEIYPAESVPPADHSPNDKAILIKVVNGDNIILSNLTIDGFYYPNANDKTIKLAVLNRLIWFQNTKNSKIHHNLIMHAGGECIRIKTSSINNEIYHNTIRGCGYYQFKVQKLDRLRKNGEGVYIGTDPYQIRVNQINKQAYYGTTYAGMTDKSRNNLVYNNDIYPGYDLDLNPPPTNPLASGISASAKFGDECVDIKEDFDEIGQMVTFPGVSTPQLVNNIIRDNKCQGQYDEDSGGLDARGSNNIFERNWVTGVIRGSALLLGGGDPKPITTNPQLSDPDKGCNVPAPTVVATRKWQAYNNRIRKNIFESYYNDTSDFNGRGGYQDSDCDTQVDCSDPTNPQFIDANCEWQKITHVVKTFNVSGYDPEVQASGTGVCGNVANLAGSTDWGTKLYNNKQTAVAFTRVPSDAVNLTTCSADSNNPADTDPPGPRGCVGYECAGSVTPVPTGPTASCPAADLDGDCHVTASDLKILLSNYSKTSVPANDLNHDGRVDMLDGFLLILSLGT